MAATKGIQLEFNPAINDWTGHWKRLQQFSIANAIENDTIKRAILLNSSPQDAYSQLQSLCVPNGPESGRVATIVIGYLESYYKKQNTKQNLSMSCDFGTSFDIKLCQKPITSFNRGKVCNRLFTEKSSITLAEALTVALTVEAAQAGILQCGSEIKNEPIEADIHQTSRQNVCGKFQSGSSTMQNTQSAGSDGGSGEESGGENFRERVCFRCGFRFVNTQCNICSLKGHLSYVCKKEESS
ncbi:hypothetical protein JTB14_001121 [Gonioctena quinquepunctata]|nr:hypothetical protein JTB14_001121 [Gonioctena quinquepunctata]